MTPRRRPESPLRPLQILAGTSTAQQIITVRKKQKPISVPTLATMLVPGTFPLAETVSELTLIRSVEKNAATTGTKAMEPHNSATCWRGDTTGRADNTGVAAGRADGFTPRAATRGLEFPESARRRGSTPFPPVASRPAASTSLAISNMLTYRWAGFLANALPTMFTYGGGSTLKSGGEVRCFIKIS